MKIASKFKIILFIFTFLPVVFMSWLLWDPLSMKFQFAVSVSFFGVLLLSLVIGEAAHYWLLTRQLNKIKKFCEEVKTGNYDVELLLPGQIAESSEENELLYLMRELNLMKHRIASRENSLKNALVKLNDAHLQIQSELEMAEKIQNAIIPAKFPLSETLQISGSYQPMGKVGGDFYDVFMIDEKKLGIIMADVCGHGLPAALITMTIKIAFSNSSLQCKNSAEIVSKVNQELFSIIGNMEYFTAFFGILDIETGYIEYTNAGHPDTFIIREDNTVDMLKTNSPIIGFLDKLEYKNNSSYMKKGDKLVLFTDGIIELKNKKRDCFGMERFIKTIQKNNELNNEDLINTIMNELVIFKGDVKNDDDISLLIVKLNESEAATMIA